ncbi:MAG: hypothetical protein D6711_11880 [Chloroflexi bacterium]|nr:MAG: hypothetical protein D6711_11880 [Chloroflexota bacterium]
MTSRFYMIPRALMMLVILVALLGGLGSGLARLGWQTDSLSRDWMLVHGPLMISGFLGTLICLERAVALASRYRWSMIVPIVNALGALLLLLMPDSTLARFFLMLGSLGLVGLFGIMLRLHPSRDVIIMTAGALCWLAGNRAWLGGEPIYNIVHFWVAFLVLTIVGERLELSRIRRLTPLSQNLLVMAIGVYLMGVVLTLVNLDFGVRLLGVGAILMAGWLLHYGIARRTIRQQGLPRYIAVCLLTGYLWMAFGGGVALWQGAVYAGPDYAVILHAFLLGFVFSMIFGHMPIILPALTGLQVRYTSLFYGHLVLLHITLIYRMLGNFTANLVMRQQGALLNVVAILIFMMITAANVLLSYTNSRRS